MKTTHERGDLLHHNQYLIQDILGIGGQGVVYLAQHLTLDVPVAIKELFDPSTETREHFLWQARLLVHLSHPALPNVMDFFEFDERAYLVMEYIAGQDMDQRVSQGGPQPIGLVLAWADRLLAALHYLHNQEQSIIHRDIKPANLKVTSNGQLYLVDFGLAKIGGTKKSTMVVARGYTEGFAPPEQYGYARTGPRSDIYALGATLYYLLVAKVPMPANMRASGDELISLTKLNPTIPPAVATWIEKAMSMNRNQRWSSAAEMRAMMPTPSAGYVAMPPPVTPATEERYTTGPQPTRKQQRYTTGAPPPPSIQATRQMGSSKPIGASQPVSQGGPHKQRNRGLMLFLSSLVAILLIAIIGFSIMTIVANNNATPTVVAEESPPVSSAVVASNNETPTVSTLKETATPTATQKPTLTKSKEATPTKEASATTAEKSPTPTPSASKETTKEPTSTRRAPEATSTKTSPTAEVEPTNTLLADLTGTATEPPIPSATQEPLPSNTVPPQASATQAPLPTNTFVPQPSATQPPLPSATQPPLPSATLRAPATATLPPPPTATLPPPPTATLPPPPTATLPPPPTATLPPPPTATLPPPPTATLPPPTTATLPPPPTATLPPPPTATTPPLPTNTPVPAAPANYSTGPNALEPADGTTANSESVTFKWSWNGPALAGGQQFRVMGFRDGEWLNLATTASTQAQVWMPGFGNFETSWQWYVIVIDSNGNEISPRSATVNFGISVSSGGGSSGGGDDGGGCTGDCGRD